MLFLLLYNLTYCTRTIFSTLYIIQHNTISTAVFSTDCTDIFQFEQNCAKPCTSPMKGKEARNAPTGSFQKKKGHSSLFSSFKTHSTWWLHRAAHKRIKFLTGSVSQSSLLLLLSKVNQERHNALHTSVISGKEKWRE